VLGIATGLLQKYVDGDEDAHRRGEETRQLDITYRGGPLSPAGTGALRPGDRAPDAPLVDANGKRVRLFELFRGPHATELRFGDVPGSGVRILPAGSVATGTDLLDEGGHAYAAYDVQPGTRVLIRPDNHVWSITRGPSL
jgi:hypothetical protein